MTINTMVHQQDTDVDEFILEIFEEQEDQFYFPVTSQNQARAFVKALHTKGLTYEDLCEEIGEIEHNFSAWRKGLGRAGIGNRMIDRINKPLHEVLESDEEDFNEGHQTQTVKRRMLPEVRGHVDSNGVQNNAVLRLKENSSKPNGVASTNTTRDSSRGATSSRNQEDALKEYREKLQKISTRKSPDAAPAGSDDIQKDSSKSSSGCSSSHSSSSASPALSRHMANKEQKKELASSLLSQIDKKVTNLERRISDAVDRKRNTGSSSTSSRSSSQEKEDYQVPLSRRRESPQFGRKELDRDKRHSSPFERDCDKPSFDDLLRKRENNGAFQRGSQDEKRRSVRDRISLFNDLQDTKKESPKVSRENSLKGRSPTPPDLSSPEVEKDVVQNIQSAVEPTVQNVQLVTEPEELTVEQSFTLNTEPPAEAKKKKVPTATLR